VLGADIRAQLLQHRDKTVDRTGREAIGRGQAGHRVVGAIEVARAIDQQHDGQVVSPVGAGGVGHGADCRRAAQHRHATTSVESAP